MATARLLSGHLREQAGSTWLNDINPGNTVHGRIAFDMPTGDKAVKIELHDSMFSDG